MRGLHPSLSNSSFPTCTTLTCIETASSNQFGFSVFDSVSIKLPLLALLLLPPKRRSPRPTNWEKGRGTTASISILVFLLICCSTIYTAHVDDPYSTSFITSVCLVSLQTASDQCLLMAFPSLFLSHNVSSFVQSFFPEEANLEFRQNHLLELFQIIIRSRNQVLFVTVVLSCTGKR